MFAQNYTPAAPGVQLAPGTPKLQELYKLAQQFEQYYPGVKIKFLGASYNTNDSTTSSMITQAAGGQLPDIWFQQYATVNTQFPKGVALNLNPYLQQPDPYVPGNTKWASVMNPVVLSETEASPTTQYDMDGDYVGVTFFYNKSLFAKAGISGAPTTWAQLIADCKKLQAHGITPGALEIPSSGGYDWLVRVFLGNFLGQATLQKIDSYSATPGITAEDQAIAYHNGILNPTTNPKVLAWWPYAKQLYSYFDKTITALPLTPPPGTQTSQELFAAGKIGLTFTITMLPSDVKADGGKINIGSFPFPSLAGSSPDATSYDTSADAGGPEAGMQWFVSTPKSDSSMSAPGKQQAVLDWLRFIGTPQRTQAIVNELGSFTPTFQGTTPIPSLRSVAALASKPWEQVDGGEFFSTQGHTDILNLYQQYMLGNVTFAKVKQQYAQIIQTAYNAYLKANPIDFSKVG